MNQDFNNLNSNVGQNNNRMNFDPMTGQPLNNNNQSNTLNNNFNNMNSTQSSNEQVFNNHINQNSGNIATNQTIGNQQLNNETLNTMSNNQNNYSNNNTNSNNNQNTYKDVDKKKEKLGTASLVLGIISIALSFFLSFLILPIAIVGLVLGIVNKAKKGKKIAGIILNAISIVIIISMIVITFFILKSAGFGTFMSKLYNELDYSSSSNFIAGNYDCTGVDENTDEYLITLHLYEDNTFIYGPYGNLENNYAKGTYTFEDEHKTNGSGDYKYFMVTLTAPKENFMINGVPSATDMNTKMEFGITSANIKKQGVIMFLNTYNMYYCYEN